MVPKVKKLEKHESAADVNTAVREYTAGYENSTECLSHDGLKINDELIPNYPGAGKRDYMLIGIFCGFIFVMMLAFLLMPKNEFSVDEKRVLAEKPTFSIESVLNDGFEKGVDRYISDHFPGRKLLVGLDAYFALYSGRNGSNGVYLGSDDYLLRTPVFWDSKNLDHNLTYIRKFAENTGLSMSMMVVPTSGYVEQSKLPWNHDVYQDGEILSYVKNAITAPLSKDHPIIGPTENALDSSENEINWIDVMDVYAVERAEGNQSHEKVNYNTEASIEKASRQTAENGEMKTAKNAGEYLFYKTDHHWTSFGAYLAYVQAGAALGYMPIPRADFQISSYDGFYGTSYSRSAYWLTPPDTVELWEYKGVGADRADISQKGSVLNEGKISEQGKISVEIMDDNKSETITSDSMFFKERLEEPDMYQVFLDGNHSLVKIVNENAPEGKLLVIKDSYGHTITPFLANHYREVYMVDLRYYRQRPVSELAKENGIRDVFVVYSLDNLMTDKNIMWLK